MTTEAWLALVVGSGGAFATVRHIVSEWRKSRREVAEIQRQQTEHLLEMRVMMEAETEQSRRRDVRRKQETTPPRGLQLQPVPVGEFDVEDTTDIHELRELKRRELSRGLRAPRPGTHHDKER